MILNSNLNFNLNLNFPRLLYLVHFEATVDCANLRSTSPIVNPLLLHVVVIISRSDEGGDGHLDGDLGHEVEGVDVEPGQVGGVPLHQQLAQHGPLFNASSEHFLTLWSFGCFSLFLTLWGFGSKSHLFSDQLRQCSRVHALDPRDILKSNIC